MDKKIEINHYFGYGIIPKKIMRDKNLSLQAKAIYSYLASFAGNKGSSYPSVELITSELNISRDTFYKYLRELKQCGAVVVEKGRTEKGTFVRNIYNLQPYTKISDMDNSNPCPKNPDMAKPYTDKPDPVNVDTNSNSFKSNSLNSNNIKKEKEKKETFISIIEDYTDNEILSGALLDFIEYRKGAGKKFTLKALKLNLNKLDELTKSDTEKVKIIEQSIERSWSGLFPLKKEKLNNTGNSTLRDQWNGIGEWKIE